MDNPYQAPVTASPLATSEQQVAPEVIRALGGTKGWVRFLGVLGFVMTAFIILAGIAVLFGSNQGALSPFDHSLLSLVYFVMGALYFYASFKLNQYASKIRVLIDQSSQANLADALEAQRGFWKYVGICTIVGIAFYLLLIFFVIAKFAS